MSVALANPAVEAFHEMERIRGKAIIVPPVARLGVAVAFLLCLMSFGKYELSELSALAVYPFSLVCFERVALIRAFSRFWVVLLPVFLVGLANPFFDREIVAKIGGVGISGGWLSFAVLSVKGIFSLAVTWALLRKIGVDGISRAFASLRFPPPFAMSILLLHRYLVMMIKETERMKDAYLLRSGLKSRAILPSSWGPFVGLLLMRSMDRAANVQAAIDLRGGSAGYAFNDSMRAGGGIVVGALYFFGWTLFFFFVRFFDPMHSIGERIPINLFLPL